MTTIDPYVSQVSWIKRDVTYDPRAQQTAIVVAVHFNDGTASEALLILDPDEQMSLWFQLDNVIDRRKAAGGPSEWHAHTR
ncbi:hypothetical protein ACIHFE_20470 [Streptomyces sp. NPDC052396]|uniref:hypothetical protein n=1 Tax=Streptomyces sp. NPDC052396 TaxID=3365689 RepID=UPI0037CE6039